MKVKSFLPIFFIISLSLTAIISFTSCDDSTCWLCLGSGICSVCDGRGTITEDGEARQCNACEGSGKCNNCNGSGMVSKVRAQNNALGKCFDCCEHESHKISEKSEVQNEGL